MAVNIKKAESKFDYARCIQVRTLVFTVGQSVPPEREIDQDEDDASHFLAEWNGVAIGAGRWRPYKNGSAKVERLAVLDSGRSKGIGKALMQAILKDIKDDKSVKTIILGSQDHAIPFYKALGFETFGEGYMDGGTIPHHDMKLDLQ